MLYTILRAIFLPIFHILFRIEIIGDRTLPKDKPFIIAANHRSNLDPLLVVIALKNRKIHFMAKKELFENKILNFILTNTYVIPVDRNKSDISALKKSYKVLKNNEILGIFPEGTRVKGDEDIQAKAGIGMFALRTNTPVVPVSIIAEKNYKIFSKIKIIFHKPYNVPIELSDKKNQDNYLKISNQVMEIIKNS